MTTTRKAGIYLRISMDRTGERQGVKRHLEDCRRLVESHRMELVDVFEDNDLSASNGKRRSEWERMLRDLAAGRLDTLVAWNPDRLTRTPRELEDVLDSIDQGDVSIATVRSGTFDLSTPTGRAFARQTITWARLEVEIKAERQKRANLQRAEQGNVGWARRPFGYDLDGRRIVVVPHEADELRDAAKRALAGESLASIARGMDDRGVVTTLGGKWSVNALKRLLTNPRHAGRAYYRGEDVGPGDWEPIFDTETHTRLVALLTDPKRKTASSTTAKHLLSGIALCGRCGRAMYASPYGSKGRRYLVYRCHEAHLTRRLDLVDEVVNAAVLARLRRPDVLQLLSPREDVSTLAAESGELRERLDGLAALYAEKVLTAAGVREESNKIRERLADLQSRIAAATGGEHVTELASAGDVVEHWQTMSLRHRRAIVSALVKVTIEPAPYKGARFDHRQVRIEYR